MTEGRTTEAARAGAMRVLVAPDSFKGTIGAAAAAAAIAAGWRSARPSDELVERPMADGGEGTLDAFGRAVPGARRMPVTVHGPDGREARLIGLDEAIAAADLVITGEGSYDGQSAAGKAPAFVAGLARSRGVPTALVAGRISGTDAGGFAHAVSLTALAGSAEAAIASPEQWLRAAGAALAAAADTAAPAETRAP